MKKYNLLLLRAMVGLTHAPLQAEDAGAGAKAFMSRGCIGCHGASGKAPIAPNYPVIGGKPADFVSAELIKFRSGERKDPTMNAMAAALSDSDIDNLAAYLDTQ